MLGKVSPDDLAAHVFQRKGADLESVLQGPAYGEDAAAIDVPEGTLVVSSDPLWFAVDRVGTLGVHVACNDVAASGGDPTWMTNVVFLPADADAATLERITTQIDEAAESIGVAVVGGHSEYNQQLDRPLLMMTCMGMGDPYVPTGGASPGDELILTQGAAIEGTAILASDFESELREKGVDPALIADGVGFFEDIGVTDDAAVLRSFATGMHDPTEGGLIDALLEMASASEASIEVDPDAVPIREATAVLTDAMGVDPFRIFGSGALLATVPAAELDDALGALTEAGIEAAHIGSVVEGTPSTLTLGERVFTEPVRDDMYRLWE
ncbi:AIR synthase family protein [Halodesulfurarchaeum sp. HSR-GB]|uniref:AIR synthase family protein n=1 Tax=Halodesulfurarchaeum sp. HSR-GB TaxID=3074077 RepID=UPI0028673032|nr:AIR synthase family protein [Halodesulfurarchaeum sp. HSR-GB]MDR5657176.1 AIR synthase family protein [Halodesulfurarchaeum sp. HSR-GB]